MNHRTLACSIVSLFGLIPAALMAQGTCAPTHTVAQLQGNSATQGAGGAHNDISPLVGQTVTLEGIVIGDYQSLPQSTRSGELRGFFLQEEVEDQDADPMTSEGLFVFTGNAPAIDVAEGQKVCVTGPVSEFFGMSQVSATGPASLALVATDQPLPPAVVLTLPVTGDVNDFYEQYEGMRVSFANRMIVSEYFEVARYGQIVLTADARPFQYTHLDTTPTAAEYSAHLADLARRRIILDDLDNTQNAALPAGAFFHPQPGGLATGTQGVNYFRGGDSVQNLTGVLHWSFAGQTGTDAWRIRPTQSTPVAFTVKNPRPAAAPARFGQIRVAGFNVLNYFTTIDTTSSNSSGPCGPSGTLDCRGADSAEEFERQNEKLIDALRDIDADVLSVVEIENNGDSTTSAIAELTARLNEALGSPVYAFVETGTIGTDAIAPGILYKRANVRPRGAVAVLDDAAFVDPNSTGLQRNRPAIAQTFDVVTRRSRDQSFTVVVAHLKSKGADGATGLDADQLDGQSAWNDTRTKAADYLVNTWLPSDPTGQGDHDVLILGDLNAYRGESPITTIRAAGYRDLHQDIEGARAYSYVFDGQLGYIDHALASPTMNLQVGCTTSWPINADEVPVFDYNDEVRDAGEATFEAEPTANTLYEPTRVRTSDHDPVVVDLNVCPAAGPARGVCLATNLFTRAVCVASKRR